MRKDTLCIIRRQFLYISSARMGWQTAIEKETLTDVNRLMNTSVIARMMSFHNSVDMVDEIRPFDSLRTHWSKFNSDAVTARINLFIARQFNGSSNIFWSAWMEVSMMDYDLSLTKQQFCHSSKQIHSKHREQKNPLGIVHSRRLNHESLKLLNFHVQRSLDYAPNAIEITSFQVASSRVFK